MNCLICNKSSEKSLCDDCSNKKRCKDCNTSKSNTNFYIYKNGKMYSTCIQCFNKKVRCEFCNRELNKSYLRSHVKKHHVPQHYNQDDKHTTAQLRDSFRTQLCDSSRDMSRTNINTGGDLLPATAITKATAASR